jgi:alpha-tubulin suppressor-like RCC1 family protein
LAKRVEGLRGVRASSGAFGFHHKLALTEGGMVYAWGENWQRTILGNPHVERKLLPKPVEALRGVRVSSVAAATYRSYAVSDTGEVWSWGWDSLACAWAPLGHGEPTHCPVPKPIEWLRGIRVDAVAATSDHTLALADDGSVYAWGTSDAARRGALGLGSPVRDAKRAVRTPQRIPALRVGCELCDRMMRLGL